MEIEIRPARPSDSADVSAILLEAAAWLEAIGQPLWRNMELRPEKIEGDLLVGLYYIAWNNGDPAGVVRFQLEDPLFWPDVPFGESAFIHRLAVKRAFAGKGVSTALLVWAKRQAKASNRKYLRLDCAIRPKLCAFYEKNGFRKHSEKQIDSFAVCRYEIDVADSSD